MRKMLRNNGLSISLFGLFLVFLVGLSIVGQHQYNDEQLSHGSSSVKYLEYLTTGTFLEAVMENWESEFLQMFAYVLLTVYLFQKGSAESKKLDEPEPVDRDPRSSPGGRGKPWPALKGGVVTNIYEHSLGLALFILFIVSFALHALGGVQDYNREQLEHGGRALTSLQYLATYQFWFQSLQNWQSEFFSMGMMIILSIVLRQRGSPESKPVDSPDAETED